MPAAEVVVPVFDFIAESSVVSFSVPTQDYLDHHPNKELGLKYGFLAAAACVIDQATPPRILLVQRAASDSMPGCWEVPGGACDDEDPTVLHSVARELWELWEEAALIATKIGPQIGDGHVFPTCSGRMICKLSFLVETMTADDGAVQVKLDPREHQSYVWATEAEVKGCRAGGFELVFTTEEQRQTILTAFDARRRLV